MAARSAWGDPFARLRSPRTHGDLPSPPPLSSMTSALVCVAAAVLWSLARAQIGDRPAAPALPAGPSSFSCHGRPPGYYADLEAGCRAYHVCDGHSHFTYLCPRRTLFRESTRICDHSHLVPCGDAPRTEEPPPASTTPPEGGLRLTLKDLRSLFYIPEGKDSLAARAGVRQVVLPAGRADLLAFRDRGAPGPPCPGRCDPRFLLPGSCHPCLVVK